MLSFASTHCYYILSIVCASVGFLWVSPSNAQITPDSTLPNNSSVNLQGNTTLIEAGTTAGKNLFHSFREFSIPTGAEAYFHNSVDINNILTRVTGGSISNIDGLIRANGSANLFLINPSGIVFGENARLDIGGSFVGSTADAIGFDEDNFFSASNPQNNSSLLQINPNALFFNQLNSQASIQSNSTADVGLENILVPRIDSSFFTSRGLRVADGKSLLLVGGNVTINGGGLTALGGRVELGGLSGTGRVGLNVDGDNLSLSFPSGVERSDVAIRNSAGVRVIADDGGSIAINAGNVEIVNESFLFAGIDTGNGSEQSKAGNIDINATGGIKLDDISFIKNYVLTGAKGQGGDINISSANLGIEGGAGISTRTFAAGNGGKLTVQAEGIFLSGRNEDSFFVSRLFTGVEANSSGNGGDLTVKTNDLTLIGANMGVNTSGGGDGGNLTVEAEDITLVGSAKIFSTVSSFFQSSVSGGDGGNIAIKTNNLELFGGPEIEAWTDNNGNGGNLTVEAQNIRLFGSSRLFTLSRFRQDRETDGNAGDLTIKTNNLLLRDEASVETIIVRNGGGGNLSIEAEDIQLIDSSNFSIDTSGATAENAGSLNIKTNTLLLQDGSEVRTSRNDRNSKDRDINSFPRAGNINIDAQDIQLIGINENGLGSRLITNSTGRVDAGDLNIKTNTLLLKDGAEINTTTLLGKGGDVTIEAEDIQIIGSTNNPSNGLSSSTFNTGNAGNLNIKTNTLLVKDGARVSASTFGAGDGGNITVEAEDIQLTGENKDGLPGGLFTTTDSIGDAGGSLDITTNTLLVKDGARVSARTSGAGKGGNINVEAQEIKLIGERKNSSPSGLFITAEPDSTGDAGESLDITTNSLLVKDGAEVSASTSGEGKGGNINVKAEDIQLIGESKDSSPSGLFTTAFSTGNAGENLNIETNTLLVKNGARVSASTFGAGDGGNITVEAEDIQLTGKNKDGLPGGLFTTAFSIGNAGESLNIKTNTLLVKDGAEVNASTVAAGDGGKIEIEAENIQLIGERKNGSPGGLFTTAEDTGDGGDLEINANILKVENGAQISAEGSSSGRAGNLFINADSIRLNDKAQLNASTQSNKVDPDREQATINITSKDLIMRHGSNIFTNAQGENVIGGNININTDVIAAFENSDITADSDDFRGGNVLIKTQGLFGIQFRPQPTDFSDITATGASDDLSGNVEIINPDIDLNTGLVNLPSIPVETKVAEACAAGSSIAQSRFEIIGRGGLPHLPTDALSADAVQVDLVSIKPENNKPAATNVSTKTKTSTPKKIVEATGWVRNDKGEIFFVVDASNQKQTENWYKNNHCRG